VAEHAISFFRDNAMKNIEYQGFLFTMEYIDANANYDYAPANIPSQFKNITIKNITFEKSLRAAASIDFRGDISKSSSLENITFENVIMKGVNPVYINGLKKGMFRDVQFIDVKESLVPVPWVIMKSSDLKFEGKTPKP
jgi:hypothetical protein